MTTVTGLTAARMLDIEANSIVDGSISGDDLILTKHNLDTINAGNVRGPAGAAGAPGNSIVSMQVQVLPQVISTISTWIDYAGLEITFIPDPDRVYKMTLHGPAQRDATPGDVFAGIWIGANLLSGFDCSEMPAFARTTINTFCIVTSLPAVSTTVTPKLYTTVDGFVTQSAVSSFQPSIFLLEDLGEL